MYGMGTLKNYKIEKQNVKTFSAFLRVENRQTFFRNIFEILQLCLEWVFRLFSTCKCELFIFVFLAGLGWLGNIPQNPYKPYYSLGLESSRISIA